jgi:hypothetical protein
MVDREKKNVTEENALLDNDNKGVPNIYWVEKIIKDRLFG